MKTIRRKLDEICGIDLGSWDKKLLKGGTELEYPYCYCYDDLLLVNWGYCGTGSASECKSQLEALYPGLTCFCWEIIE